MSAVSIKIIYSLRKKNARIFDHIYFEICNFLKPTLTGCRQLGDVDVLRVESEHVHVQQGQGRIGRVCGLQIHSN